MTNSEKKRVSEILKQLFEDYTIPEIMEAFAEAIRTSEFDLCWMPKPKPRKKDK